MESLKSGMSNLETLPARVAAVEGQILQLRDEMRGEFSGVRNEIRGGLAAVRGEMQGGFEALRSEMLSLDEQRSVHMRVLHEEVMSKFATMDEGRSTRSSRRRKP